MSLFKQFKLENRSFFWGLGLGIVLTLVLVWGLGGISSQSFKANLLENSSSPLLEESDKSGHYSDGFKVEIEGLTSTKPVRPKPPVVRPPRDDRAVQQK
ncbi:MAG TPA: hypothetical protein PLQ36_01240 [Candidatus Gracilibacteria bacterium]|nr:hypothetical protein [Candidatus Gracilibacteria bacterium]